MGNMFAQVGPMLAGPANTLDADLSPAVVLKANSKVLWRNARREARYSIEDIPSEQLGATDDGGFASAGKLRSIHPEIRLLYKSKKYRMVLEGTHVRFEPDSCYRLEDALSAANFFEYAEAEVFTAFCTIVHGRGLHLKVASRIKLFASGIGDMVSLGWEPRLLLQSSTPREPSDPLAIENAPPVATAEATPNGKSLAMFDNARALIASGEVDRGLDLLYSTIDDILYSGDYSDLNSALKTVDVKTAPLDFLLGMLTASLPVKRRLNLRPAFFALVKESLIARGEFTDRLLDGLE